MKTSPLDIDRLDEIVALVLRCDETWRPWAPLGWNPPPAARERASWKERLEGGQHWVRGVIGEEEELLAVATWRPARERGREGPRIPGIGHLGMLFVDPGAWGRGIGGVLLTACEESMRRDGCAVGRLNVAERNPARAFYERHGWAAAGPPEYSPGLDLPLVPYDKRL
jgi:GNAT superfamily N-acetyltransferase